MEPRSDCHRKAHMTEDASAAGPLPLALDSALGKPTKLANDADLQGSAVVTGHGLELVITLGTGVGTAIFEHGMLTPHLELAQHPLSKGRTYNGYIGDDARQKIGGKRW